MFNVASTQVQLIVALLPSGNEAQCCLPDLFSFSKRLETSL